MPPGQAGQVWTPPQPLPMVPQYCPPPVGLHLTAVAQVVLPQTPGMPPPPQVPVVQVQLSEPPQPSPIDPQYCTLFAPLQVPGTHAGSTQMPPRHSSPPPQVPQSSARPQPSPIEPQYLRAPVVGQAAATHAAPPTQTPFSQILSPGQAPQSCTPEQPSPIIPQYCPVACVQATLTQESASGSLAGPSGRDCCPPSTVTLVRPPPPPLPLLLPLPVGAPGALTPAQPPADRAASATSVAASAKATSGRPRPLLLGIIGADSFSAKTRIRTNER